MGGQSGGRTRWLAYRIVRRARISWVAHLHHHAQKAARDVGATGRSLSDVVKADAAASVLTGDEIDRILDPLNALGATQAFIESALAQWEEAKI